MRRGREVKRKGTTVADGDERDDKGAAEINCLYGPTTSSSFFGSIVY